VDDCDAGALPHLCSSLTKLDPSRLGHSSGFLQDETHRIRFVYIPKHCSWLNQVELWFSILTRRLLKRGSFKSIQELKQRVVAFIDFFNETLAKPFRWTYIGKPLAV
jgi:transposase